MTPSRAILPHPARLIPVPTEDLQDVRGWLVAHAVRYGLRWLLAYMDDGVVWGRIDGERLVTSYDVAQGTPASRYCPPLRGELLQQARLFARSGELLLWRDGDNQWQARLIEDCPATDAQWR